MLLQLLTLPVSFPLWVVKRVLDEAEARYYDEKAILSQIAQINEQREQGAMGEEEFQEQKAILLSRLREARDRKSAEEEPHG